MCRRQVRPYLIIAMKLISSLILMLFIASSGWAQTFSVLFNFNADKIGRSPTSQLVQAPDGTLYGERFNGVGASYGTLFAINANGTGFTNLFSFNLSDGGFPEGGLLLSGSMLYGTTSQSETGYGTVFAINTNSTGFTNLYNFSGSDGSSPEAALMLSGNTLYGTTYGGGTNGYGVVFAINTNSTGFTNLFNFGNRDGGAPETALLQIGSTLYGTTYGGGTNGDGEVFSIQTNGTAFTNLRSFDNYDGYFPLGTLVASGSTLYGTTLMGGSRGYGEVFAINIGGTGFTNLYSFTNSIDGGSPEAGLVLSGKTLYGTAYSGGTKNFGAIFAIHTDGTGFTNIYSFTNGIDGAYPAAALLLSSNILYGTANGGGTNGYGTIYSLTLPASPSPPALSVHFTGNNLIVTWPSNATGFTLETATSLGAPGNWNPVTNVPTIVNGQYTITNAATGQNAFYYLSH